MSFNHFDDSGRAIMVDISGKKKTLRTAIAVARVAMRPEILPAVLNKQSHKGDVLGVARLAGISACKRTSELIPLAHPLSVHHVSIDFELDEGRGRLEVRATVKALERTGVEMEAMVAASLAALTIYDMCKGMDKSISIEDVALHYKEGGKSGVYRRSPA